MSAFVGARKDTVSTEETTPAKVGSMEGLGVALVERLHGYAEEDDCIRRDGTVGQTNRAGAMREAAISIHCLRRALHDIVEVWAGAECGEPVHAQEAYAIHLCKQMYALAAEALKPNVELKGGL